MLHMYAAHMLHTKYIHIACMLHTQKLAQRHTHATYKHLKKCIQFVGNCLHAACMLYINNCMYAAHNNCTHVAYMYSDVCDLMLHACVVEPILVCGAHMQYGCIVCAARVQHICTICAARKQIYVQHTSNISI